MDLVSPPDASIGCDYAGEVVELGSTVQKGAWSIGDRVAGVAHGGLYKGVFNDHAYHQHPDIAVGVSIHTQELGQTLYY